MAYRSQARTVPGGRPLAGLCAVLLLLVTTGASCHRDGPAAAPVRIAGLSTLAPPPAGRSWAPRPVTAGGLVALARAGAGAYALHTSGGDRTFLPGVNLGSTTPGSQPGELPIGEADYRAWFAAMGLLGVRVVRNYELQRAFITTAEED
ncbi:hypothetical protein Adi01nite_16060 [Amorphoplanes digitatis]|uniref:hypothetical protein n=1 Tax=Actinoplanes digitatis TaxID=1868 RepID=UPI001942D9CA|nr:hypothetical protein [Actinoplanes digitatis]GID92194.1 hypothetical protein Adi01nite_16060 [Actinoplanes digitatis]